MQKQLYAYSIRFFDDDSIGSPFSDFAVAMYALTVSGWNRSACLFVVFKWLFTALIVIFALALFFRSIRVFIIASSAFMRMRVLGSEMRVLRLAIPARRSRDNLPYSAQARLQQLLQMQVMYKRLRKIGRRILWKRLHQERKRRKQAWDDSFCLFFAASASSHGSIFLAFGSFFVSESVSASLPFGSGCLQLNYLVQPFNI